MKNIKKLSLIFMKSLNLDIKNRIRVNINSIMLFYIFCKANLIFILNLHKLLLAFCIINIYFKLFKLC